MKGPCLQVFLGRQYVGEWWLAQGGGERESRAWNGARHTTIALGTLRAAQVGS